MEGDGQKARHRQRRGDGGGLAVELEQREHHRHEQRRHQQQRQDRQPHTHQRREHQQRPAQVHDLLMAAALTDGFADYHGGGGTQTEAHHQEQAVEVAHHGVGRQHLHGVVGVAQDHRQHTVAEAPCRLIEDHGGGVLHEPLEHFPAGAEEGPPLDGQEPAADGTEAAHGELCDAGQQGSHGGTLNAQRRQAALAEDQQVVQPRVQHRGHGEQLHTEAGVLGAAPGADIQGREHIEHVGDADELQIRRTQHRQLMVVGQQVHDLHRPQVQHRRQHHRQAGTQHGRHADGTADVLHIPLAPVLAHQNAQAALHAEHDGDQQEHRHVGGGDGGHLGVAQPADHQRVHQAQCKGDKVLQGDGAGQTPQIPVKARFTFQTLQHGIPHSMENLVFLWRSSASYRASMSPSVVSGPKLSRSTPAAVLLSSPRAA